MTKRFFVTGTDTEVGKTIASSALLQAANLLGFHTAGYKPVASGSELTGDGLRNEDALALQRHSRVALRYDQVNPYTFAEPTSRTSSAPTKGGRSPRPGSPAGCVSWKVSPTGCWWKAPAAGLRRSRIP